MAQFQAEIFGSGWKQGPTAQFDTIAAARAWAEEYGTTADSCTIKDSDGDIAGEHRRNPSSGEWFEAEF